MLDIDDKYLHCIKTEHLDFKGNIYSDQSSHPSLNRCRILSLLALSFNFSIGEENKAP